MMEFAVSEKMQDVLGRINEIVVQHVHPLESVFLAGDHDKLMEGVQSVREVVRQGKLWTPQMPRDIGGMGLSLLEHGMVSEALGRSPLGHFCFNCQAPDAGNMEILYEFGTDEQKAKYLAPLVAGKIRSCFSMTEPAYPGSNPVWMGTTAVKEGGAYVISGRKWFSSSADGSAFAIVMAVTDPQADPHMRASQIIVPTDAPGFNLVRNIPIMGETGKGYFSHGEIQYENCRVPVKNLLGQEGAGFAIAQSRLGPGRIHHCMRWIGICERVFDLMCDYAAKRELAPGQPAGTKQMIQDWIARSRAEINASRLMVLHAAWKIDTLGIREAREEISVIKFYVAKAMMDIVDRAIQVHGGLGVTDDTLLSWYYRHERGARIYDGPDEVHKMVVAKRILKSRGINIGSAKGK